MKRSVLLLAAFVPFFISGSARAGRDPFDAAAESAAIATPRIGLAKAPPAVVASRDDKRGVPTILWESRAVGAFPAVHPATPEAAARFHLARHAARYGLSAGAIATAEVVHIHDIGRGGIIVVLRQQLGGVEVFHNDVKILMDRNLDLFGISGNLHPDAVPGSKATKFAITDTEALASAFGDLYEVGATVGDFTPAATSRAPYHHFALRDGAAKRAANVSFLGDARVKQVFYAFPDRIVPAWFVELDSGNAKTREGDAYLYIVSADDGRVLHRENLKHDDAFTYRVWATPSGDFRPTDGPLQDFTPYPGEVPNGTYPAAADPVLISMSGFNHNPQNTFDPWLPAGATVSKGNNVDAYTDDDMPDGFSKNDIRASVSSPGVFDHTYDLTMAPRANDTQRMATITQLFYLTNWLHDWWYDSGFTETAGNAQESNLGRGGIEKDPLHAEAQDGAPKQLNNSNMSAFFDGKSPRMQMYLWSGATDVDLNVDGVTSDHTFGDATFGPHSFDLTAPLEIASNGGSPAKTDGCDPITNDLTGKIAVIDRGTCAFEQKSQNAQAAHALGVLILDNQDEPFPLDMDATHGFTTSIPVLGTTQTEGNAIKAAIAGGPVNATMHRLTNHDRDGGLDNTIAAHEWGHYLHLRQVACGNKACSGMSEGFADFDALLLVIHDGDDTSRLFPLAQYATVADFDDPGYFGIRRYPYTTDMSKNPLIYSYVANDAVLPQPPPKGPPVSLELLGIPNSEVHNIGEVWASLLFEAYASLLAKYPYAEAHRRMSDYIEAGFQLAPTDPTILEQRDAILAAARVRDPSDFLAMAKGFAKRGAGSCALSPTRESSNMNGAVDSFDAIASPVFDQFSVTDDVLSCDHDGILDVGETGTMKIRVTNAGWQDLENAKVRFSSTSRAIVFLDDGIATVPKLAPNESAFVSVKAQMAATLSEPDPVFIEVNSVRDPSHCDAPEFEIVIPTNLDEVPSSSAVDEVETAATQWTIGGSHGEEVFSRIQFDAGNHLWLGVDFGEPSDATLTSPTLDVGDGQFLMWFMERHSFEVSCDMPKGNTCPAPGKIVNWDGAVVEVSTDGGKTFEDVSKFAKVDYEGTIGEKHDPNQALAGRMGFVAQNKKWPQFQPQEIDFGKSLANKHIKVRFRIASDDATGAPGWFIDGIHFVGITNTPFSSITDNRGTCAPAPSSGSGGSGGGGTEFSSSGSECDCNAAGGGSNAPFWLAGVGVALAALRRRRRQQ